MSKKNLIKINNFLFIGLSYIIGLFLISLNLYRFRQRWPRDIFISQGAYAWGYFLLFCFSFMILSSLLYYEYIRRKKDINIKTNEDLDKWLLSNPINSISYWLIFLVLNANYRLFLTFNQLLKNSKYYDSIRDYIINLHGNTPIVIFQLVEFFPRIVMLFCLIIDVFYFEKFYYFYFSIYLFAITLLFKLWLYWVDELGLEISTTISRVRCCIWYEEDGSITILEKNGYAYDEENKRWHAINAHAIGIKTIEDYREAKEENDRLKAHVRNIREKTNYPIILRIFIQTVYTIIWFYICYYYPIPIFTVIGLKLLTILIWLISSPYMIFLTLGILYYLFKK